MSGNNDIVYAIAQHYLYDLSDQLTSGEKDLIHGWIRSRSLAKLASCSSYLSTVYSTTERARAILQLEAFFKKNSSLTVSGDTKAAALEGFQAAEKQCRITNKRLDHYYLHRDRLDPDMQLWLDRAERYVGNTLGSIEPFIDALPELIRFTAGATATQSRKKSQPHMKVKLSYSCSSGAAKYVRALSKWFGYGEARVRVAEWNRVTTVPKNWKTDRTIACEQEGNLPLQLAFDTFAKRRLRKKGIDLSDQSRNQRLARSSSLDGSFATIDMKSASDTVAYNTVAWLFPQPWFRYLSDCRASLYRLNGDSSWDSYAKFSSMGNGATFCIETLVFAACCYAVGSKAPAVYGDDVIIETELVDSFLRLTQFLGFSVNLDKTHIHGPFRESCGANCFEGTDITPFYMREIPKSKASKSHLVNGLVAISLPGGGLWQWALRYCTSEKLYYVPFNSSSMSGVWIDPHSAWRAKLLTSEDKAGKLGPHTPKYRAWTALGKSVYSGGYRTLFLWYLDKYQGRSLVPRNPFIAEDLDAIPLPGLRRSAYQPNQLGFADGQGTGDTLVQRSRVPHFCHRMVRKWVRFTPEMGVPAHLYWWAEDLKRRKAL